MSSQTEALTLLQDVIKAARQAGAEAADAVLFESVSLGTSVRLGKPEDLERSESNDLGLRVLVGRQQAFVAGTDKSRPAVQELVERAVAMAKAAPEDKYCGLAEPDELARQFPDLDLTDGIEPAAPALIERAKIAEDAALAVAGVTNSEGASASYGRGFMALVTSNGFAGAYDTTRHSVSVSVIAGRDTGMEVDHDFSSTRYLSDLGDPARIGRNAGERAVKRLNPRKVASQSVPVIFDPRISNGLVGHLASAISGAAVARGTSFLKDRMGQQVFAAGIRIVDDPLRRRGLRSRPFDGEGVGGSRQVLVEDGRLLTWLLDTGTARQLGLKTNGHASRGTGSPPSPGATNLYLEAGKDSPADLIRAIDHGFYITDLIGFGVNGVTGDYSRGASGFWIEKGELAYPVSELTIAGNLKDMFLHMVPANDLNFRFGTDAPTVRIDGMTVAGT